MDWTAITSCVILAGQVKWNIYTGLGNKNNYIYIFDPIHKNDRQCGIWWMTAYMLQMIFTHKS